MHDVRQLLDVLDRLVDAGNTVLVVEHNLDVVKRADHVIDLGPEGGAGGGRIVVEGTPEKVARTVHQKQARRSNQSGSSQRTRFEKQEREAWPARKSSVVTPAAVERALKKSLTAIEKQSRDPGPPAMMVRGARSTT